MAGQSGEVVIVPRNFVLLDELDKSEKARRKPPAARPAPRGLSGTQATVAGGWGHDVLLRARAARRHLAEPLERLDPRPDQLPGGILDVPCPASLHRSSLCLSSLRASLRLSLAAGAPPDAATARARSRAASSSSSSFVARSIPKRRHR